MVWLLSLETYFAFLIEINHGQCLVVASHVDVNFVGQGIAEDTIKISFNFLERGHRKAIRFSGGRMLNDTLGLYVDL